MIQLPKSLTLALALGLSIGAAQAADAPKSAEHLIPAGTGGAFFVNLKQIRASFGQILNEGRAAAFLDELVSKGLPDLRKDIDEAGAAFDMRDGSDKHATLVARGNVNAQKIVEFLQATIGGQVTEEAYRGVIIKSIKGSDDKESFQVAAHDEALTMLSVDEKHSHELSKPTLDVLAGRLDSYGAANHVTLPDGYMLAVSWTLPEDVRQSLARNPMTQPLSYVVQATGALKIVAGDSVRLDVSGRCENALQAQALQLALKAFRQQLLESGRLDEQTRRILEQATIEANGATTTLSIEVPRQTVEDILRGFVGGDKA